MFARLLHPDKYLGRLTFIVDGYYNRSVHTAFGRVYDNDDVASALNVVKLWAEDSFKGLLADISKKEHQKAKKDNDFAQKRALVQAQREALQGEKQLLASLLEVMQLSPVNVEKSGEVPNPLVSHRASNSIPKDSMVGALAKKHEDVAKLFGVKLTEGSSVSQNARQRSTSRQSQRSQSQRSQSARSKSSKSSARSSARSQRPQARQRSSSRPSQRSSSQKSQRSQSIPSRTASRGRSTSRPTQRSRSSSRVSFASAKSRGSSKSGKGKGKGKGKSRSRSASLFRRAKSATRKR